MIAIPVTVSLLGKEDTDDSTTQISDSTQSGGDRQARTEEESSEGSDPGDAEGAEGVVGEATESEAGPEETGGLNPGNSALESSNKTKTSALERDTTGSTTNESSLEKVLEKILDD